MGAAGAIPGIRSRETVTPDAAGVHPPLRGRYLRPRSVLVDQTPEKILDPNPNRLGAWIFNNGGGLLELPLALPASVTGLALAKTLDSGSAQLPSFAQSSFKTLYLLVDTALAWVTGAQPTLQLIVGRAPWGPASGAATQAGGDTQNSLKGTAANLGPAAATSLARGLWPFSPTDIADLQWQHPYIGAELVFGSALTAGAARLFVELQGAPNLYVGEDNLIDVARPGGPAGAFVLSAQANAQWVVAEGELWAAASQGGVIDVRIWEVLIEAPAPGRPTFA